MLKNHWFFTVLLSGSFNLVYTGVHQTPCEYAYVVERWVQHTPPAVRRGSALVLSQQYDSLYPRKTGSNLCDCPVAYIGPGSAGMCG